MTGMLSKPPIFLDRDGTLVEEVHYLSRLDQMRLVPGAAAAVAQANRASHAVVVVTNQSGVARGLFSEAFVVESGKHLGRLLAQEGARLDGYYYCPYHPEGNPPYNRDHTDRKPGDGMLRRAVRDLSLELRGAWMIGDKVDDLNTGAEAGVVPLLVRTGNGRTAEQHLPEDFQRRGGRIFDHLPAAIDWILTENPPIE